MLDPLDRWSAYGEKPDYAGPLSFSGTPYTQNPADLQGVDVAIVGAPMDDLVSDRPGTRFAPRAIRAASCPPGPNLETKVDAFSELQVVDFGDAPVIPADPARSHDRNRGDSRAGAGRRRNPDGPRRRPFDNRTEHTRLCWQVWSCGAHTLRHPHRHRRGSIRRRTFSWDHDLPSRRGTAHIDTSRYAQIGLRGYWPGDEIFAWQAERSITSLFMHEVRDLGIKEVVRQAIEAVGERDRSSSL